VQSTDRPSPLRFLRRWLSLGDPVRPADLIFVLAGRQSRKEYALELFRQRIAPRILLSVGRFEIRRFAKLPLPVPLDLLAIASGVPPPERHYFVEFGKMFHVKQLHPGRFGTLTELESLARWLEGRPEVTSIVIVSSPWHLRRVRMCCRALLREALEVKLAAVPEDYPGPSTGPSAGQERAAVLMELLKLPVYWMVLRRRRR
jgi:hypothetical protein